MSCPFTPQLLRPYNHQLTPLPTTQERKYFDSGDYALSKAGKASDAGVTQIGREHPNPNTIPHLSSPLLQHERNGSISAGSIGGPPQFSQMPGGVQAGGNVAGSPVKESSFLHRETSVDDVVEEEEVAVGEAGGLPIRGAR